MIESDHLCILSSYSYLTSISDDSSDFLSRQQLDYNMHNSQPENIEALAVFQDKSSFILTYLHPHRSQNLSEHLRIDRNTVQMTIIKQFNRAGYHQHRISAFLGIVSVQSQKFLVFCDHCKRRSTFSDIQTYEISSLNFQSISPQSKFKQDPKTKQIYSIIRDYYIILKKGFYFSHNYNLTVTLPQQSHQHIAENYAWNLLFFKDFETQRIPKHWKTPIIQGFINSFELFYKGAKIRYCLISRRSSKKGGTRYFDRGINDEGYVANYCQTQQIIKIDEYLFSDLQIRGSLPLYFQQVGVTTRTKLNRGYQLTHQAYLKHIEKITSEYKRVFMSNLLSLGKKGQKLLTEAIEQHIKKQLNQSFKYLYYDFHAKVHGGKFEKVDQIIEQLRQMKLNLGYYVFNTKLDRTLSTQNGVFRTNCLDCLDRTNFFQAKLAIITLESIFKQLDITDLNLLEQMINNKENAFIKKFRSIWADNGDMISYHYTGTGSTHTDITRDGKRGFLGNFKHKYKTVARFYNQYVWDFYKMKVLSRLLDKEQNPQQDPKALLNQQEQQYSTFSKFKAYIWSWKTPKNIPKTLPSFPTDCNFLVISLQDITQSQKWLGLLEQAIDSSKYLKVESKYIYGNMLLVYAHHSLKTRLTNIESGHIKFKSHYTSFMSNKSAVFIRLNLDSTKIVFSGCMLEKGRDQIDTRIKNLKQIHEYAFQLQDVGILKSQNILFDDIIFLIGNMNTNVHSNYRNDIPKFTLQSTHTQANTIKKIIASDQFQQIKISLMERREYQEAPITFLPTYRFINGSFDPENSGWPDRIWYSGQPKINCLEYDVAHELRQQHVPVYGRYEFEAKHIDEQKYLKTKSELLAQQQLEQITSSSDDEQIKL